MASENNEDFPNVENKSVKPEDAQKTDESIEELTGSGTFTIFQMH